MKPGLSRPEATARDAALRLLARREHARRELAGKLEVRGFAADAINDALDELTAAGLLSDGRFAEVMVRHRVDQGYGPRRIRMELERQGVEAGPWLAGYDGEWREIAGRVYARRYGTVPPADIRERAKRVRWLEGRGFPHDVIRAVMDG